ncbi:Glycosyltransferase family 69 protein [Mycena kentingensis (nom. inval.)]|nr:Glycosyltransferase family 69 protein [Mycena kentingensis (nom. inval.)]
MHFAFDDFFRVPRRLFAQHPHACASSLLLFTLSTLWRIVFQVALSPRRQAYPESRTLFTNALFTLPLWGLLMCVYYVWSHLALVRSQQREYEYALLPIDRDGADASGPRSASSQKSFQLPFEPEAQRLPSLRSRSFLAYLALVMLGIYVSCTSTLPEDHRYSSVVAEANRQPRRAGYASGDKIFIAAMFYDNEDVVPYWTRQITRLVNYLGPDNVFISIVESYSADATPALLLDFASYLSAQQVPHRIIVQDTTIPRPSSMETAPPRIDFLAATRNRAIEPLLQSAQPFDRIIFSNDIFVEAESIVELLNTNNGQYDMACGVDFQQWGLYDLWVARDTKGGLVSGLYPYFLEENAFSAVVNDEPVPVSACWNGIVSVSAEPFLRPAVRRPSRLSNHTLPALPPTHPLSPRPSNTTALTAPQLNFRASALDRGECFSSESFLLPYDLARLFGLERVYMNTRVVTAYRWRFYVWYKRVLRHWAVRKWMRCREAAPGVDDVALRRRLEAGKVVLFASDEAVREGKSGVWTWDGGECHPGPFPGVENH